MARNNKLVQGRLFDRLDMLLSKKGAEQELAECITEVSIGPLSKTDISICLVNIQFILITVLPMIILLENNTLLARSWFALFTFIKNCDKMHLCLKLDI